MTPCTDASFELTFPGTMDVFVRDNPSELREETLYEVTGATPLYVNRALIRSHMGWVPEGEEAAWLRSVGGWISDGNRHDNAANATISIGTGRITGRRPPRYGRASIIDGAKAFATPVRPGQRQLVELKGCGVAPGAVPSSKYDGTGLLPAVEAFKEVIVCRLLTRVFAEAGTKVGCIPLYGIVGLGVQAANEHGRPLAAAVLVRGAHFRPPENDEIPLSGSAEEQTKHRIEETLRMFGLTSTLARHQFQIVPKNGGYSASYGVEDLEFSNPDHLGQLLDQLEMKAPATFRFNNVQIANECGLVPLRALLTDLGHYIYQDNFDDHVLVTPVRDRPFNFGLTGERPWLCNSQSRRLNAEVMGKRPLADDLRHHFGVENVKAQMGGMDALAYRIVMQLEREELKLSDLDEVIDGFIASAF